MKNELPSLITPDPQTGLALAGKLAEELRTRLDEAGAKVERPGGMNFLVPPTVPEEVISSILFYAIAAANHGWPARTGSA